MMLPSDLAAWLLRLGVAVLLVAVAARQARRMPVSWPRRLGPERRARPSRPGGVPDTGRGADASRGASQAAVPSDLESWLEWVRLAMVDPAQFNGFLVDRLLDIAGETGRGRPRLFAMGADPAVRQARAAEVLGSAGLELARGLPPTIDRIRAAADAIRRRWEG